jgi:putative ABC transport system permease protein
LRSLLVITETALTVVLLVGAALLLRSFVLLLDVDPGVDPHQALTADLFLAKRYADPERREVYVRQLVESIERVPGVQAAAVTSDAPLRGGGRETFTIEGQADPGPSAGHPASFALATGAIFRTMGIPIRQGRAFDQRDAATSAPVAIVNEAMARQFWKNGDAVGKRLRLYYDKDAQRWLTIVGVVGNVRNGGREVEPTPQVYVPFDQNAYRFLPYPAEPFVSLVVRTTGDPATLAGAVQAQIWSVDKDQVVSNLQTMERLLAQSIAARRVYLLLLAIFAAVALVIASAGVYGMISYEVARRTPEMGIRMALGATRRQILALVLRQGMQLTVIGVGLGFAAAIGLRQVIAGFLYGVTATDMPTFLAVLLIFAGVAFIATYIPARRAATVDPTIAFRYE